MGHPEAATVQRAISWRSPAAVFTILFVVILVPFVLWQDHAAIWVERAIRSGEAAPAVGAAVIALLALDVVLPIPSNVVSTMAGVTLGLGPGIAVSAAGMTLGCVLGYALRYTCGFPLLRRLVSKPDLDHLCASFCRNAPFALVAMRAVPVMAEASTLFAGVSGMSFSTYLAVTALANTGVSIVYCSLGSRSADLQSFLLAFAASLALPSAAMLCDRLARARSRLDRPVQPPAYQDQQQEK